MANVTSNQHTGGSGFPRAAHRLRVLLDAIKFEHTVFALPFAYIGMVLADDTPAWTDVVWITVAMFAARTVAMGTNRIVDRHQDAANPRTRTRALPAGLLSMREMTAFTIAAAVLFFVAAGALNRTALALAPVALILLVTYPYAKRYTWLCHWYLGIADGIAPAAGWIAVTGSLELTPVLLFVAVTVWVAGFDLLYALQDVAFDRSTGLHSVPADLGIPATLWIARGMHAAMIAFLAWAGAAESLGVLYWIGLAVASGLLVYEHQLVRPNDLSRLDVAFFNMNGYIAVTVFAFTLGGLYVG